MTELCSTVKRFSQGRSSSKYIPNYTYAATEFDLYAICCDLNDWSGKRKRLTAKGRTSRQKWKDSRQKKKPYNKEKTSRQKEKTDGKKNNLTANEISMSSRHKRERIGAGRFFLLPWVFSFSPWGSSFYGGPCNVSRQKQNLQQDKANPRQDNRNSRQISTNSRQDNANFSRRKWETKAEVKCHSGCNLTTTSLQAIICFCELWRNLWKLT